MRADDSREAVLCRRVVQLERENARQAHEIAKLVMLLAESLIDQPRGTDERNRTRTDDTGR